MRRPILYIIIFLLPFSFLSGLNCYGADTSGEGNPANRNIGSRRYVTIDFDNVDILLFIKYISELTGKNFIVDKTVRGNVTIVSPTKISEEDAYHVFESVLEVYGFTTVPSGAVIKIVPTAAARSLNVDTLQQGMTGNPEDKVVTQLIPLKHSSPEEIKKALAPLLSKASVMIANTQSGMLIVTETHSNIQRLLSIISAIDVPNTEEQLVVIPMKNGSAVAAAKVISSAFQKTAAATGPPGAQSVARIVPYERINALVVMASNSEVERIRHLVALLDTEKEKGEGNTHVFYLQNANAKELAKVLNTIKDAGAGAEEKGKTETTKESKVLADEETNSLIINAPPSEYRAMENMIKKLDIPRRMVFLETLIMEVNTSKDFQVGVQWAAGGNFSNGTGTVVSGFSGNAATPYDMVTGLSSATLPAGGSFGILKEGIKIGGVTFPTLGAVINAYKKDSDVNIISTPQVLTTDNKKAEISVGENVPYITSKNTTSGTQQDYTNYEYKDVSTKLTITPHINQSNVMRLEIKTEVLKLKDNTASLTPTTLKRTADTTVIIQDGETVVIGGIIGQDATEGEYKVPLLGDIPVLGWLFKTSTNNSTKTNMFIFVTPHIIKNPADMSRITHGKEAESGKGIAQAQEQLSGLGDKERSSKFSELGHEKLQHNQIPEAREYFLEALQLDPENVYAWINIAEVYEKEGQRDKAVAANRKVLSITSTMDPDVGTPARDGIPLRQIARENLQRLHADTSEGSGSER